jgi:serine/threonine-protein kinase
MTQMGDSAARARPITLSAMTDLGNSFRVIQRLGAGAAGEVHLVENCVSGRLEALKILTDDDATVAGRFRREVRAMRVLHHQNIVTTYDAGLLPDGRLYLTMEYVAGTPLDALLRQRGPLPIGKTLGILAEVGDALFHAHQVGVLHRDLKPHNMILSPHPSGEIVKIVDFGLAKILGGDEADGTRLSRTGDVFGTPAYMAPEQVQSRTPDPRTDIYAVGCIAYELLIGAPPFTGKAVQMLAAHVGRMPTPPSAVDPSAGIPPELDWIVLRCLAKQPEERFASGADLCAALQHVPGYRPLRAPPRLGAPAFAQGG